MSVSIHKDFTAEDIKHDYALGKTNFAKLNLSKINLKHSQLQGINLQGSDLRNVDLSFADLSFANLSNCYLNNANLANANLTNANLTNAYLSNADCQKTIFQQACLVNSFLTLANLSQADLTGAKLKGAHLNGVIFTEAIYNNNTYFDQTFNPNQQGLIKVSLLKNNQQKYIVADLIKEFENIIQITTSYLGKTMTIKHFNQSRPNGECLQAYSINENGKIIYPSSVTQKESLSEFKHLENWINSFVKTSSLFIHDLPKIIQQRQANYCSFDDISKNKLL